MLFASYGFEREVVRAAELVELLPGLSLPVARSGHLQAMKLLAADDRERPQDQDDIRALLRDCDTQEIALARAALRLTTKRGYHRGKDLERALDAALERWA